jgi:hypothetical protein
VQLAADRDLAIGQLIIICITNFCPQSICTGQDNLHPRLHLLALAAAKQKVSNA